LQKEEDIKKAEEEKKAVEKVTEISPADNRRKEVTISNANTNE
jgi:hypothetical protein